MALKVFEVEVTVTKTVKCTGTVYVLAESAAAVENIDASDFEDHADYEQDDGDSDCEFTVSAAKDKPLREAAFIVRDGAMEEAEEEDYEAAEGEQPIIDDRTVPLALPYCNKRGKVLRVERVEAVAHYPSRAVSR